MNRILLIAGLLVVGTADVASACEYCLGTGSANESTVRALVLSMASLLSMIGFISVGIGMFFYRMHQRGKTYGPSQLGVNEQGNLVLRN